MEYNFAVNFSGQWIPIMGLREIRNGLQFSKTFQMRKHTAGMLHKKRIKRVDALLYYRGKNQRLFGNEKDFPAKFERLNFFRR